VHRDCLEKKAKCITRRKSKKRREGGERRRRALAVAKEGIYMSGFRGQGEKGARNSPIGALGETTKDSDSGKTRSRKRP